MTNPALGRRLDRWIRHGLLSQTIHWHTAQQLWPGMPKWRWRLARAYYNVVRYWRIKTGWFDRHPRKSNPS